MRTLRFATILAGTALTASTVGLVFWSDQTEAQARRGQGTGVVQYQVDGSWPKPFPTTADPVTGRPRVWIPGEVAGTCIDSQDHVFIVTRGNLIARLKAGGSQ